MIRGQKLLARVAAALLLFRLPRAGADAALTVLVAVGLAWSRFALLANGPWEWDETLFARGILHFELAAHFPHPPGFPGWLAIGHLLMPLVGEPLRALQLASAAFSVAAVWPLAALGRRVAPPAVAVAAALAVLAAPGPWLYSVRGFTTTAAAVFALGGAAIAAGGLGGRRITVFTLLLAASVLVRPHLLPVVGLLWLVAAWRVRPRSKLVPGLAAALVAGAGAVAWMVRAEGGWSAFVAPFFAHSQRHFSRLADNLGGYPDLGLVKGLGGVPTATLLFCAALVGLAAWWRRAGRGTALAWALVLSVAAAQLVWLQNRTYGRYAVGVQMAVAPLVAGAAAALPPAAATGGLLGLAAWLGACSLPLVEEQHHRQLPGWEAVQAARLLAADGGRTAVVESELYPFASYLWHLEERRGSANPPLVLSPWDPAEWSDPSSPWIVATVHRHFYPPPLFGFETALGGVSDRLEPLTQQRFLNAWVILDPPLPVDGWWPAESAPDGRRFMWGDATAELLLPPLSRGSRLRLLVGHAPGIEAVALRLGEFASEPLPPVDGFRRLEIEVKAPSAGRTARARFVAAGRPRIGTGDPRELAVQLLGVRAFDPERAWTARPADGERRWVAGIELDGAYGVETFADGVEGVWLAPRAVLRVPAAAGRLTLQLTAPRPTSPRTVIRLAGTLAAGPLKVSTAPRRYVIEVPPSAGRTGTVELELVSVPYSPAAEGGRDSRTLGVVLSEVAFEPRRNGS